MHLHSPLRNEKSGVALALLSLALTACSDGSITAMPASSGGSSSAGGAGSSTGGAISAGGSANSGGTAGSGGSAGGSANSSGGAGSGGDPGSGGSGGSGGSAGGGGTPNFDRTPEGTCARWNADHADTSEGVWSGSVASCNPGDISADGRANALRLLNLMRWLADLPAVETTPERNTLAQACALMMDAANDLDHNPGTDWPCYTEAGALGAATSNISGGPGVMSINLYMIDNGNETTFGHRRIILGNRFGPVGLGSTGENGASCMQNNEGTGEAGKEWVSWPPPGVFPMQAYEGSFNQSLSETGWHVQSEEIEFDSADVTISSGGTMMPVSVSQLTGNYGNNRAIRIVPEGWDPEPGSTYSVNVSGVTPAIAYDVEFVDCDQ